MKTFAVILLFLAGIGLAPLEESGSQADSYDLKVVYSPSFSESTRVLHHSLTGQESVPQKETGSIHAVKCPVGCESCQASISKALDYLAERQLSDGSWEVGMILYKMYGKSADINTACLAGLTFLAEGSTPKSGKYKENISRAAGFILKKKSDSKLFSTLDPKNGMMQNWHLSFAALFLAEVYAKDPTDSLKKDLTELAHAIEQKQESDGGWRHGNGGYRNILISTVSGMTALTSLKEAGISVSDAALKKGVQYIHQCKGKEGEVRYSPTLNNNLRNGDGARTAASVYILTRLNETGSDLYKNALPYIEKNMKDIPGKALHNPTAAALWIALESHLRGEQEWKKFWDLYRTPVLETQSTDGYFKYQRQWEGFYTLDGVIGLAWTTALHTLILQAPSDRLLLTRKVENSKKIK